MAKVTLRKDHVTPGLKPTGVADELIDKLAHHMAYLYTRWQDEKKYEDWADYDKSIRSQLPPDATNIRIAKRPFEVRFRDRAGFGHRIVATARAVRHLRTEEPLHG